MQTCPSPLPGLFSQSVGRISKFHSHRFFASSSCVWKGVTQPACHQTQGGERFLWNPLFGVRARFWGPQGTSDVPKNYLQGCEASLKFSHGSIVGVKSYPAFCGGHWHTDTHFSTESVSQGSVPLGGNFCVYVGGWVMENYEPCKIFTTSLREVCFTRFTREE